jgi:SprT protein
MHKAAMINQKPTSTNQIAVHKATVECLKKADKMFGTDLAADTTIDFSTRGRIGGWAYTRRVRSYQQHHLSLNGEAVEKYTNDMIVNTVPHEIAHLVCNAKPSLGDKHNQGWKRVCRQLGGSGDRCHKMDLTPARVVHKFTYILDDESRVDLTAIRHKKIQSGRDTYTARGSATNSGLPQRIRATHYVGALAGPKPTTPEVPNPAKKPAPKAPGSMTKKSIARVAFNDMKGQPRKDVIAAMIAKAGLTPAGAATYYQTFKKEG